MSETPMNSKSGRVQVIVIILSFLVGLLLIGYISSKVHITGFQYSATLNENGATVYYYPEDLNNRIFPTWSGTNAVPLKPEQALSSARRFLLTHSPAFTNCELEIITLEQESKTIWYYDLTFKKGFRKNTVRVLMDGEVWEPSPKRRY